MEEKIRIDLRFPVERIEFSTRSNTLSDEELLRQTDSMTRSLEHSLRQQIDSAFANSAGSSGNKTPESGT